MTGSIGFRGAATVLASSLVLALAGCGSDGATGDGGLTQPPPAGGGGSATGSVAVTVSGAVPSSGNGVVTGSIATSTDSGSTFRTVLAEGTASGSGTYHAFSVTYDAVSGVVEGVVHQWGVDPTSPAGRTLCVRNVTSVSVGGLCSGVTVDLVNRRVTFVNTVLRGQGTFASTLQQGTITFVAP